MTKQDLIHKWNEWMAIVAAILGPMTSLIFEEKYSFKQIVARLTVGAASAIYLGGPLSEAIASPKWHALAIYMCGVGGYYIIRGVYTVFQMFGVDPGKAVNYVLDILSSVRKAKSNNQNTPNENGN